MSMEISPQFWRKCSNCKKEIPYRQAYYQCNVSTCNRKRTGLVFCSIPCFEQHLPGARHRDAYAVEELAPSQEQWQKELSAEAAASSTATALSTPPAAGPRKIIPTQRPAQASSTSVAASAEFEVLVVASKVKDYIRRRSEMNMSAEVLQTLSHHIRRLCDEAIDSARDDGRKTVMERDFKR